MLNTRYTHEGQPTYAAAATWDKLLNTKGLDLIALSIRICQCWRNKLMIIIIIYIVNWHTKKTNKQKVNIILNYVLSTVYYGGFGIGIKINNHFF